MLLKTLIFSFVILFGITSKVLAIDLPIDAGDDDDMIFDKSGLPQELLEKIGDDEIEEISVSIDNKKRSISLKDASAEADGFVDLSENYEAGQKFISELLSQEGNDDEEEIAIEEDRHSDLLEGLSEEQLKDIFEHADNLEDALVANRVA